MKLKKLLAGILTAAMALTAVATPLGDVLPLLGGDSVTASAATITTQEVLNKLDGMIAGSYGSEYKVGNYFSGSYAAKFSVTEGSVKKTHWNSNSYQCMGFAKKAFEKLFSDYATTAIQITYTGDYKDYAAMKDWLIATAKPGDYLRFGDGGTHSSNGFGHSGIIYSVDSDGLKLYEANGYESVEKGTNYIGCYKRQWGNLSNPAARTFYYKVLNSNVGSLYLIRSTAVTYVETLPTDRFTSVSTTNITSDDALVSVTAVKSVSEKAVSFGITVYPSADLSQKQTYSFNSSYPNGSPTNTTNALTFQLKSECGFKLYGGVEYTYYLTSTYNLNGTVTSYNSQYYKFTTGGSHTHSFGAWYTIAGATCTANGAQRRVCSICGAAETQSTSPLGHSFGDWYTIAGATCTTDGAQRRVCSRCDATETKSIAATGHNYSTSWTIDKAATCTAAGSKSHHCLKCGAKKDVTAIAAKGHSFGAWKTTKAATYTATGTKKRTCTVCGKSETKTIAKKVLAAVTGVNVSARTDSAITLKWSKNADATGYKIFKWNSSAKKWVAVKTITSNSTLTYKVTGLESAKQYSFIIKAYKKADGVTALGNPSAKITAFTKPAQVTGLAASAQTDTTVTLKWNECKGADGYIVKKYNPSDKTWSTVKKITSGSTLTYNVTGLSASSTYYFSVCAYKGAYSGAYSSTLTAYTAPAKVTSLSIIKKTNNSIQLHWNKVASAQGYIVDIYKNGKWSRICTTNTNTILYSTATGLTAGTYYTFRVWTYRKVGTKYYYGGYAKITTATTK